ncbi:hypothetical protein GO491_04325 [Flavobacteriaceae bacterium Ap0902]|nr:hypothetical protein [Flavobacteriaceae bacterium Ap0902]
MNFKKAGIRLISIILGLIIFFLGIQWISKPNNQPLVLDPMDSIQNYLFAFTFSLGDLGYILALLFLVFYMAIFIFLGNWIYSRISRK